VCIMCRDELATNQAGKRYVERQRIAYILTAVMTGDGVPIELYPLDFS